MAAIVVVGCVKQDVLYCETDADCVDNPGRPYCDVAGTWPQSEGIGKTCIASPFDAGVPDPIDAAVDAPPIDANPIDPTAGPWSAPIQVSASIVFRCNGPKPSFSDTELYVVNSAAGMGDIDYLSRSTTGKDWSFAATSIPALVSTGLEANPTPSPDGLELYFERPPYIFVSTRASQISAWGDPVSTGLQGSDVDILSDGLTLYYKASGTSCPSLTTCRVRMTRADTHSPWGNPKLETLQTNDGFAFHVVDFSGDGLHALLSSAGDTALPAVGVSSRPAKDAPWGPVVALEGITQPAGQSGMWDCASWSWSTRDLYLVGGGKLAWSHLQQ